MEILNGIHNFFNFIEENWTAITVVIGLVISVVQKVKKYITKSDEEKIAIAKTQIHEGILKLISDAEKDYEAWNKTGSIKRSQVIGEIFAKYPILSKVVNQEEIIRWIDKEIDNALVTLREVIEQKI